MLVIKHKRKLLQNNEILTYSYPKFLKIISKHNSVPTLISFLGTLKFWVKITHQIFMKLSCDRSGRYLQCNNVIIITRQVDHLSISKPCLVKCNILNYLILLCINTLMYNGKNYNFYNNNFFPRLYSSFNPFKPFFFKMKVYISLSLYRILIKVTSKSLLLI